MADKWMDERDRQWRDRDWRRSEQYGRGGEERSFGADRTGYRGQDRVFGERETGASYTRGGGVSPGGGYGGPAPGRGGGRPSWQDRDFGGASPGFASEQDSRGFGGRDSYGRQGSRAYGRPYGDQDRHDDRGERFEDVGRSAGEFLHRAGERVASWFSGDDRDGYGPERQDRGHRGRGPKGYKRSDERINEEVHERLTEDHWLDASHVSVAVSEGEVTLSGSVDSREAKHRAERLVEDISGVNHVQNNLRIDRGDSLTGSTATFSDSVLDAQMGQDDPTALGTGGAGSGQSTAGRKT